MSERAEVLCIFRSTRRIENEENYSLWSAKMDELVRRTRGYLRHVSVHDAETRRAITVSYFDSNEALDIWRHEPEHQRAQELGRHEFYEEYVVEIATLTRSYRWSAS